MRRILFTLITGSMLGAMLFCLPTLASARDERPSVLVEPKPVVKAAEITLGEIAKVFSSDAEHAELVKALKAISFGAAPKPKASVTLQGEEVLAKIVASGFTAEMFGYSIPKEIVITRAGRTITEQEVQTALKRILQKDSNLEMNPQQITFSGEQIIPLGETALNVELMGEAAGGRLPIRVDARVDGEVATRFLATAIVDDWREVPVLTRTLDRGMLISPDDYQLARVNMLKQSGDIVFDAKDIVGNEVKNRIEAGETIKKRSITIPPVITRGSRVAIVYRKGALFASANGEALDDGFRQSELRVRNTDSRRVVNAWVLDEETVEVK